MNCYCCYYYYYNIWIYLNISDGKASFLQSSVSHDPSEIILIWLFNAQETFLIIINVENSCSCAAYYFCGFKISSFYICLRIDLLDSSKEQYLLEI